MIEVAELSPEYVLKPPSVTDVVAQSPEAEPMTDDEINAIVHEVRRRRPAG